MKKESNIIDLEGYLIKTGRRDNMVCKVHCSPKCDCEDFRVSIEKVQIFDKETDEDEGLAPAVILTCTRCNRDIIIYDLEEGWETAQRMGKLK